MANEISIKSRNELILENILGANNVLPAPVSLTETLLTCWLNGDTYTDEIYDPSRNTSALLAIVNGTTYDATPICEIEALLAAIANGTDPDEKYLPPKSRIGALLYEIFLEKYSKRKVYLIKSGLSRAYTAPNFGELGTSESYYYDAGNRISTYDPATFTGVQDSVCEPWVKVPDGKTRIHIKLPPEYQFALRGYDEEVTIVYRLADLNVVPQNVDATYDVGESKWINVLIAFSDSTKPVDDVDLDTLANGIFYEFL